MARPRFKDNFQIRGRIANDPELIIRVNKKDPNKTYTLCNFSVAKNLNNAEDTVNYYKFTAWDSNDPLQGGNLASEIVNNFRKGDFITVTKSIPTMDRSVCRVCKARQTSYNAFTALEIDGFEMMGLDEDSPKNEEMEEITLILEAEDGVY